MNWASPLAFYLALALPLLAALFFYRRKLPVITIPAMGPWRVIGEPVKIADWRTLLRRLAVLLLQLIIVGGMVIAAAGPRTAKKSGRSTILVIDASATMAALNRAGVARFEMARELAKHAVQDLPGDGSVTLVMAAAMPVVAFGREPSAAALLRMDEVHVGQCDSQLEDAVDLAESLASEPDARVLVISDFSGVDPKRIRRSWRSKAELSFQQVGEDVADAGFSAVSLLLNETGQMHVRGRISQRRLDGTQVRIIVSAERRDMASWPVPLNGPSVEFDQALPAELTAAKPQVIELRLDLKDGLDLNNRVWVRTNKAARRVALVSNGDSALLPMLNSLENVSVEDCSPMDIKRAGAVDLIVADRCLLPADSVGMAKGLLFVGCVDPLGWVQPAGRVSVGKPTSWSPDHPLLRNVQAEMIKIGEAITVTLPAKCQSNALIESGRVPLVLEVHPGDGQDRTAVYFLFDPVKSGAAGSIVFPLLMYNAVDHLVPGNLLTRSCFQVGDAAEFPADLAPRSVIGPDGAAIPVVLSGGRPQISRFTMAGVYRCDTARGDEQIAVNYLSPRSSNPLPRMDTGVVQATTASNWFGWLDARGAVLIAVGLAVVAELLLVVTGKVRIG